MNALRMNLLGLIPIIAMVVISIILYPSLPEQIPSISEDPADTQSKLLMAVLMPAIYVLVLAGTNIMIVLSPAQFSMPNSRRSVSTLLFAAGVWMCFSHLAVLNHQGEFEFFVNYFTYGMAAFFILAGNVIGKTERNFVFGMYLPWTLASEANWRATHRAAGRYMVVTGIIAGTLNIWINNLALPIAGSVLLFILIAIYSYRFYSKHERGAENVSH